MKKTFTLLMLLCLSLAACKKETVTTEEQTTVNGSVSGTISPAGAAEVIVLVSDNDPEGMTTFQLDPVKTSFSVPQLKPGNYKLYFVPKTGYTLAKTEYDAKVTAGANADIGTITLTSQVNPFGPLTPIFGVSSTSSFTQKLDGKGVGYNGSASYNGTDVVIAGEITEGNYMKLIHNTYSTSIKVAGVTAPGTYPATISYVSNQRKPNLVKTWSSAQEGGNATVVVTSIDALNKKISGTFTGKLINTFGNTSYSATTEGSFNVTYK